MSPRLAKLAALGAFGATAGMFALYALVVYATVPTYTGGMDLIEGVVTWISLGVAVLSLAAVHVAVGRQLLYIGRSGPATRV
jgi:hypothetical protein